MERKIPKQIAIEITTRCQLRCKGCMKTLGYPDKNMDFEFYKSIVERNNFKATIIPYQNGEPFLHPEIYKICELPISKDMRFYITTNGMIWNNDVMELLTEKNSCYQVLFSLDGLPEPCSRSIENARPGSDRKIIVKNIERFIELKRSKGNNTDLCVKICQRGQDWEEVEDFIAYWLTKGVDYVCVGRMLNQNTNNMRIYPCQYFDDMYMLIDVNGRIKPCMYNTDVVINDYFNLGKLQDNESLIDAFNKPRLQELRENQKKGIFEGPCKKCGSAYTGYGFRGKFKFNPKGKHKDFPEMYTTMDYYNTTFSLVDKAVGIQYKNTGQ